MRDGAKRIGYGVCVPSPLLHIWLPPFRELRRMTGLTQPEAASLCGVSVQSVMRWERRDRGAPGKRVLWMFLQCYGRGYRAWVAAAAGIPPWQVRVARRMIQERRQDPVTGRFMSPRATRSSTEIYQDGAGI